MTDNEKNLLRYGQICVDRLLSDIGGDRPVRVRIIYIYDHFYYTEMVDGEFSIIRKLAEV